MSDQVDNSTELATTTRRDRRRMSWLRILLLMFIAIVFGIVLFAIILWVNRYSVIEQQVRKEFTKAGIEAEFKIESVSRTVANIGDISLADENGTFFSAKQLKLDYTFEKIRAGIVDKVTVVEPNLKLTLNGQGTIIDEWLPESDQNAESISFPSDGIHVENGTVSWLTPFGHGSAQIDANIHSYTSWESHVEMNAARFDQNEVQFDFNLAGNIDRMSKDELTVKGVVDFPSAKVKQSTVGPFSSDFNIRLSSRDGADLVGVVGRIDVKAKDFVFPKFAGKSTELDLDIDAYFNPSTMKAEKVNANWNLASEALSLTDKDLRKQLVRRTMSYDVLSNIPIAMYFVDEFERNGTRFFESFSAAGSGSYQHGNSGYLLELDGPLVLQSADQKLILKPGGRPEVKYQSDAKSIDLDFNVEWNSSQDLNIQNLKLTGESDNGLLLTGVSQISANISSSKTWRRELNGETFRLAPLQIDLVSKSLPQGGRVSLRGNFDYDGLLPGGWADEVNAGGEVVVTTKGDNFAMAFRPFRTIKMAKFVSTTGWRAENISFDVLEGKDILTRTQGARPFRSNLRNVSAEITSPDDDRHLQAFFDEMLVKSNFQSEPQVWDMEVHGIELKSEDFPSPGTHIQSKTSTANFRQFKGGALEFSITSPDTKIDTDNVQVIDLFIEMQGRPDDFSAEFKAGSVQLLGGEIPEVPMKGTARLQKGVLSGTAVAPMPKTTNTPINVEFRSEEGVGSAQIAIPKVVFTPRGLQPQYLIPALRGKLAEVSGEASAEFEFSFGDGGPVKSFGTTTLKNMDIGTLVGPASGVSAELTFKSIFPLETDGVQTATLAGFDAGFPLENGTVRFELVSNGVRIDEAVWPVDADDRGQGKIYISPMLWRFGNVENQAVVNVENLSLGKILEGIGKGSLSATGQIYGQLPATIKGVDVIIHDGRLAIKDGGVIRYRNPGIDTFGKDTKQPFYLGDSFSGSETGFAFKALENFQYKELEALIDGPLDGEMTLRMLFGGKNPSVLAGTAFEFEVAVSGELGNIARDSIGAFDAQKHLGAIIETQRDGKKQKLSE